MTGGKVTKNARVVCMDRAYNSSSSYTAPYKFKLGIGTTNPLNTDTDLEIAIPLSDGTVNDNGSNTLTGSAGGDNSTDNTTTYKEGGLQNDNESQNLIGNDTSTDKTWTITALTNNIDSTQHLGLWFYIKDQTTLDKIVSAEFKIGNDSSNYYSKTVLNTNLITGWNWVTTNTEIISEMTETGAVSGDIDTFIINVITNNSTDVFIAGDLCYDLLRTWEQADLYSTFVSGYPSFNVTDVQSTIRCYITTIQANGYYITEIGIYNNDSTPVLMTRDVFDGISKSLTDEAAFVVKDKWVEVNGE